VNDIIKDMPNIRNLIAKQKAFYDSIVSVNCPFLGESVYFKSDGFHHLLNKYPNKRRPINETYLKLMCFTHAPEIIANSMKIIEIRKEEIKIKGKLKDVISYELVDGKKRTDNIAVIVRKIGTGKLRFRSVKKISSKRYASKKAPFGA
jgi:hypothetical protein